MRNCAVIHAENVPFSEDILRDANGQTIFAYTLISMSFCVTWVLFFAELCRAMRCRPWNSRTWVVRHMLILFLFPVTTSCYFIAAFIPRSVIFTEFVSSCYLAFVIVQFFFLIVAYFGGEERLLSKLDGQLMKKPCCSSCCTCQFCQELFSRRLFSRLRIFVLQFSIVHPLTGFLANVCAANDEFTSGDLSFSDSFIYLKVVAIVSTILCMNSMMRFNLITKDYINPVYRSSPKFYAMWTTLLLASVQLLLMSILGRVGLWHCTEQLRLETITTWYNCFAMVIEMTLLHLLVHFYAFPSHIPLDKPHSLLSRNVSTSSGEELDAKIDEEKKHLLSKDV